ncbi:MAG: hypothetical protein NPINA01_12570 [Nitrospinaceae bacterium]|nr:MAG: hypothetical protein NPINA01_12570 [Nitrospinaceae bacterium]
MNDAMWAMAGVFVGGLLSGVINYYLQKNQFKHNKEMFLLQNKSEGVVKDLLEEKLHHCKFIDRTFEQLKKNIGGYTDDEIRRFLHEIKAKKVSRKDGTEMWYLVSREMDRNKIT